MLWKKEASESSFQFLLVSNSHFLYTGPATICEWRLLSTNLTATEALAMIA
jgi:hypothetical protein